VARLGLISKVYNDMKKKEMKRKKLVYGLLIVFGLIVIGTCSAMQEINSFEDCVEAGYPISESYPAQCRTPEGKVFVEQVTLPEEPPAPRLKLTKSASPSVMQVGETTTITIRVENIGTGDATSVEVTDTIPTGLKRLSHNYPTTTDTPPAYHKNSSNLYAL